MGAAEQGRAIRTFDEALRWGDEWVSAYAQLYERVEAAEHKAYMLQVRVFILEHEALLLKYDMAQALNRAYETEVA